jgi:Spy/CpxP family protein refolding chaperone
MDVRETRQEKARDGGRRGARRAATVIAGLGLVALALAAVVAATHPAEAFGPRGWRGFRHGHHDPGGLHDPERFGEHAALFLRVVDATEEQQARVREIATAAVQDLVSLGASHHANREALADVLGAATIDRSALEALRSEEIALADRASRRIAAALADAAEVLTPEQRAELVELAERFGPRHHGRGREPVR